MPRRLFLYSVLARSTPDYSNCSVLARSTPAHERPRAHQGWYILNEHRISASTPEVSLLRNPGQKIQPQKQQTHPRTVKDKLSCRYAFKNHTKKTVTATRTDVKNAGPTQGYFDSPLSSVLLLSALIFQSFSQQLTACYGCPIPQKRGVLSPFVSRFANYLKT